MVAVITEDSKYYFLYAKITPLLSYLLAFGVSSRTVHFRR